MNCDPPKRSALCRLSHMPENSGKISNSENTSRYGAMKSSPLRASPAEADHARGAAAATLGSDIAALCIEYVSCARVEPDPHALAHARGRGRAVNRDEALIIRQRQIDVGFVAHEFCEFDLGVRHSGAGVA